MFKNIFNKLTTAFIVALVASPAITTFAQDLDYPTTTANIQQVSYGCTDTSGCDPECGNTCCETNGCCGTCCESDCCCRDVCVATVEKETVEKHCWKVECEKVCVPKVVCPWGEGGSGLTLFSWMKKKTCDSGCGDTCCGDACCDDACCSNCCGIKPRCGKVICVRDLKKEKYECEECVCKWEIRRLPCCCCGGCSGSCDCGSTCR